MNSGEKSTSDEKQPAAAKVAAAKSPPSNTKRKSVGGAKSPTKKKAKHELLEMEKIERQLARMKKVAAESDIEGRTIMEIFLNISLEMKKISEVAGGHVSATNEKITGIESQLKTFFEELDKKYDSIWNPEQPSVVFTGSSSIRLWDQLDSIFPEKQIVNTGFGGSQASDLLYYLDVLVLKYHPEKVFIYEGDNDLFERKSPRRVLKTLAEIVEKIHIAYPEIPLVLISAKPSISRWRLRGKYRRFNRRLEKMAESNGKLFFADVWNPMLNGKKLNTSLFIEDGLHMNQQGYTIWARALRPLLELNPQNNTRKP